MFHGYPWRRFVITFSFSSLSSLIVSDNDFDQIFNKLMCFDFDPCAGQSQDADIAPKLKTIFPLID